MTRVRTGIEQLLASPPAGLAGKRLGLLCHPASVDGGLRHTRKLVDAAFPGQLKTLFSPQHGFFSEKQDNMIASADMIDPVLRIPVFSLYGHTRIPTREMFDPIDVLIIDLQDVGTRVYTYVYTMSYCMEVAAQHGIRVFVLDRPNPVGGNRTEGNCLLPECASFVGRYPIPMRHGLTIGELARLFNETYAIGCDLEVIPMAGWRRGMYFEDTGLPWVAPSPNLPTPASAMVYPGQVVWEGTNVSEGRGTTQPFELFGAPFVAPQKVLAALGQAPAGIFLRQTAFEPTWNKWRGTRCNGFQLHVTDRDAFRPYRTALLLLKAMLSLYGRQFAWKPPPYEYELERRPIDLIIGSRAIRRKLERRETISEIELSWAQDLNDFTALSRQYHLYA